VRRAGQVGLVEAGDEALRVVGDHGELEQHGRTGQHEGLLLQE
jgi:hypothetical protein